MCSFVYLLARLLTGLTLDPSRSSVKLGAPISRSGALRWLGFSTSRPLGCVLLYFVSASSFVCCCRLRECSQVQYFLALGLFSPRLLCRDVARRICIGHLDPRPIRPSTTSALTLCNGRLFQSRSLAIVALRRPITLVSPRSTPLQH